MTSIIIPVGSNEKPENIHRTIESLRANATGKIEIICIFDGWKGIETKADKTLAFETAVGERVTFNRGAEIASGKYLFRVDSHCDMSEGWDTKLKCICDDSTISVSMIDALDETTWKRQGHQYGHVYLTQDAQEKWWPDKPLQKLIEPAMSFTGCGWMIQKEFFSKIGQSDESLAKWGAIGPEMTLKTYAAGGNILIRKDVFCGHVFQTKKDGYPAEEVLRTRQILRERYGKELIGAAALFSPVPGWNEIPTTGDQVRLWAFEYDIKPYNVNSSTAWQWHTTFVGQHMQHNYWLYYLLDSVFANNPQISRIVEIGTGYGALSAFLGLWSIKKNIPILTIDKQKLFDEKIFDGLKINFLLGDENDPQIHSKISEFLDNKPCLFFCDGGAKEKEFIYWTPQLAQDSIIAAHDYGVEFKPTNVVEVSQFCDPYRPEIWNDQNTQTALFKTKRN